MKIAIMAMGLIAAGLVGGVAGGLLFTPESGGAAAPSGPSKLDEWQKRVDATLSGIDDRLRLLETAPATVVVERDLTPAAASTEESVDGAVSGAPLASADPELAEKVLDIVQQKEKEDRVAREARRAEMMAQFEAARLTRLEEELGLNSYQKDELTRILAERRKKMTEMRERLFGDDGRPSPDQFNLMREESRKIREESNTQIEAVLTPEQFTAFTEQDRGGRGGPGSGRGGGRGGGR